MPPEPDQTAGFIAVATFSKLLLNITRRLAYPFAPELARGLQVDLSAITSVIAVNQATSILGPVGAGFGDLYGFRIPMLLALAMLAIGTLAVGLLPLYPVLVLCLFLGGLAKSIFDPSLQAFIGHFVPYAGRGKIIGITELAWAGSTLIGVPAAGLVIQRFSWQTPFLMISVLSLICFFLILKRMPGSHHSPAPALKSKTALMANWTTVVRNRRVTGMLGFIFFMSLANDNLFVIYGAWLENSFHLSLAAIGFGTVFIGLSEVLGEGFTVLYADRIGLKKTTILGTTLCCPAYFLLPFLDGRLGHVLAGLFLVFFCFEFSIVTAMGLSTELVPELRASVMSAFFAVAGLGRVAGAFLGGILWSGYGLFGVCLVSGFCTLAALIAMLVGFSRRRSNT